MDDCVTTDITHKSGPGARPDGSDIILERLKGLHPKLIDLSLERIERLLALTGHPERRLPPTAHVAGTNGKGSVVAYLSAMLEEAGYATHAYTSPHLVRFHERIRLGRLPQGQPIEEDELALLLEECERLNADERITFFEITTAAAFLAFSRHAADALVLEVGMGGRFDTTNVIESPAVSVITPIDYDHQSFLGDTLGEIAFEKAGILKSHVPAVIGPQHADALAVIERRAAEVNAPLFIHGQDWTAYEEHGRLVYQDEGGLLDLPLPRLEGRHQIDNAGTALAALRQMRDFALPAAALERALGRVSWPARLQRLTHGPLIEIAPADAEIWLDGGHNPAAGRALAAALADLEDRVARPLYLICGMLATKDADGFLAPFRGLARLVITVEIAGEEASQSAGALYDAARRCGLDAEPALSLEDAMERITLHAALDDETMPPPRILICGSLYLAGRILRDHK